MSRAVRSIRAAIAEESEASNLTALAECWGFTIEWDADLHRLGWEWYDSPGLLRIGPDFTPRSLCWLHHLVQYHLLSGSWTSDSPVPVGGES